MDDASAPDNIPQYSVGELSGAIRRTLEGAFGRVRVRGELTEVKRYASGHIYLALKEEGSKLAAVIWKSAVPRLGLAPENGIEVIATGRLTAYADRSSYQLLIERLEYAGEGALLARIEALRVRLAAEGLFDAARKRPIPRLPTLIGLVTSAQGAVLQDIRTTIARRFPRKLLLWPVPVQGEGAAARIANAIAGFARLAPPNRPDLIIVARGGGSLEDLMAFNDEAVLRAAANCPIPLISAVGHETDTTLIDYVSDRRAPTPTAAAEMAVPVRAELLLHLSHTQARLAGALSRTLNDRQLRLHKAERALPDLPVTAQIARQRLDDRTARLAAALPLYCLRAESSLASHATRLTHALTKALHRSQADATRITTRLRPATLHARAREAKTRLAAAAAHLEAVSYQRVLERGYALVTGPHGPITRAADVTASRLTLIFSDGSLTVRPDTASSKPKSSSQDSLF